MKLLRTLILLGLLLAIAGCGKSTTHWTSQLKSTDSVARLHAVHAMRDRTREAKVVVPALAGALKDSDVFVRRDAARALGKFGSKAGDAIPSLREALNDPEPSVRRAAAQSLEHIDPSASR